MKLSELARRLGAIVNPPSLPGDPGPMPQLRDYPIARGPSMHSRSSSARSLR